MHRNGPALALTGILVMALAPAAEADEKAALMQRLVAAYPDHLSDFEDNELVWKDGTRMVFDDGKGKKPFDELLDAPDIEDQFAFLYPTGRAGTPPGFEIDPGRIRYEPFFVKMYGDCDKGEVARRLVSIAWLPNHDGGRVEITNVNGVADRLRAVLSDLEKLPKGMIAYLVPSAGTYNCRSIAGTKRKSVHAYGAAIDINVARAHYWRWTRAEGGKYPYKNQIPWEIVEIFERHGFIWGGKWYHYDTMHFEYRPELLGK